MTGPKRLYGIAACDERGTLGREGRLPWHNPDDLRHFTHTTRGQVIIMGRRTFASLPHHYFTQCTSIVLSRQPGLQQPERPCLFVRSLAELFAHSTLPNHLDWYVIGGAQIYELFLRAGYIAEFLLTRMPGIYEGDAFFPLSLIAHWHETLISTMGEGMLYRYQNPIHNCSDGVKLSDKTVAQLFSMRACL